MTIAQAFNLAFESWKDTREETKKEEKDDNERDVEEEVAVNGKVILSNNNNEGGGKTCESSVCVNDQRPLIDLDSPRETLDEKTFPACLLKKTEDEELGNMNEYFSR